MILALLSWLLLRILLIRLVNAVLMVVLRNGGETSIDLILRMSKKRRKLMIGVYSNVYISLTFILLKISLKYLLCFSTHVFSVCFKFHYSSLFCCTIFSLNMLSRIVSCFGVGLRMSDRCKFLVIADI